MDIRKILTHSYIIFFFTGVTGVLLNLAITGILATFFIPSELFYIASIIGTVCNLAYNFTLHTYVTFKTRTKHKRRFGVFIIYNLIMASVQELLVAKIILLTGTQYLLIIKAALIFFFSTFTYFIFRFFLFKEK